MVRHRDFVTTTRLHKLSMRKPSSVPPGTSQSTIPCLHQLSHKFSHAFASNVGILWETKHDDSEPNTTIPTSVVRSLPPAARTLVQINSKPPFRLFGGLLSWLCENEKPPLRVHGDAILCANFASLSSVQGQLERYRERSVSLNGSALIERLPLRRPASLNGFRLPARLCGCLQVKDGRSPPRVKYSTGTPRCAQSFRLTAVI